MNIKANDNNISNDDKDNGKIMWKTVKQLTNNNKQTPPRIISHLRNIISSIKEIWNIANNCYVTKISKMRHKFYNIKNFTPIIILSLLINRNDNKQQSKI